LDRAVGVKRYSATRPPWKEIEEQLTPSVWHVVLTVSPALPGATTPKPPMKKNGLGAQPIWSPIGNWPENEWPMSSPAAPVALPVGTA